MTAPKSALERLLLRDRLVVIAALSLLVGTSSAYVLTGAGMGMSAFDMTSLPMALGDAADRKMDGAMPEAPKGAMPAPMEAAMAAMTTPAAWNFGYAVSMFCMWWVMIIAMMLPSAAPMVLLHARVQRKAETRAGQAGLHLPTSAFTFGYLIAWGLFSAAATALQGTFAALGLLSPMKMHSTSSLFAGMILLFAGVYQLTPIKRACLEHCRGPIRFFSQHWRSGSLGALRMGLHHGAYCLGCCWGLMAILFFGGIMNLYWIVGLALLVLLEKVTPLGLRLSTLTGGLLLIWSASFFLRAVF